MVELRVRLGGRWGRLLRVLALPLPLFWLCLGLASSLGGPARATYTPPTGTQGWCTVVAPGTTECGYPDPQSACARQHSIYGGPGILFPYKDTEYWDQKYCDWALVYLYSAPANVSFQCASGYVAVAPGRCEPTNDNYHSVDCEACANHGGSPAAATPHPISLLDGAKSFQEQDFALAGAGLPVLRAYSSRWAGASGKTLISLPLGFANWRLGYDLELQFGNDWSGSGVLGLTTPQGGYYRFSRSGSTITPYTVWFDPILATDYSVQVVGTIPTANNDLFSAKTSWSVRGPDDRVWYLDTQFDPSTQHFDIARPTRMVEPGGLEYQFTYSGGALEKVADSFGRTLSLSWVLVNGAPKAISEIQLPDGTVLDYSYEGVSATSGLPDRLLTVQRKQGGTIVDQTSYDYGDSRFPTYVTAVHDKDGVLRWSVTYDDLGRALTSAGPSGAQAYSVAYGPSGTTFTRTVTEPGGKQTVYTYTRGSGTLDIKLNSIAQLASPFSPAASSSLTYSTSYYIASQTDNEGRQTTYTRDALARPTQMVEAAGTGLARTTNYTWHPTLSALTQTAAPGLTTDVGFTTGTSAGGPPAPTYSASQTFAFSGAAGSYIVPGGVTTATVTLWGAAGGNVNNSPGALSGAGGYVQATFTVNPGDTLQFEVGGGGKGTAIGGAGSGGPGGWPDGGDGTYAGYGATAGGGGSTRFYINGTLKAVAAGGGGSGGLSSAGSAGAGGGLTGQSAMGKGGTGGTQAAGGYDSDDATNAAKIGRSIVAYPGVQRTGGQGTGGGGGGGGYWGGGGGGSSMQSGGGGSSWVDATATAVTVRAGFWPTPYVQPAGQPNVGWGVNAFASGSVNGNDGYATVGLK